MATDRTLIRAIQNEANTITAHLIECGLVDDQNFVATRDRGGGIVVVEADYWTQDIPRIQQRISYGELHARAAQARAFDLKFLDGALVQFRYEFAAGALRRSAASFFPSPDLTPFQVDPDLYLFDEIYGDVVDRRAVTVPLRFDFDDRPHVVAELHHPHAHLTLGQYPYCRIPMSSGITPYYFVEFILRCFYRTASSLWTHNLPGPKSRLPRTITELEQTYVHIGIPT